jgi:hypothetical protein
MKKKFTLTLKENGSHSIEKGLNVFKEFEQNEDNLLLKEAIMFLHHGIELLMKQVLVENCGEYLIFSDIDKDTVKKVIKAKKEGISVFNLTNPVYTATYTEAIDRVDAFINSPQLPENLKSWLSDLNNLRNQIEHYAIDKETDVIKDLMVKIRKPLLSFFEKGIKDFKKTESTKVEEQWLKVSNQITVEKQILDGVQNDRLSIICEGQSDLVILKVLINKIISKYSVKKQYRILVANGLHSFSKTVRNILAHSIGEKIIIVADSDGSYNEREHQLTSIGIPTENQIIINPEMEVWLKEGATRKSFNNKNKVVEYNFLAEEIDIEELKLRDKSFEKLLNIIVKT